MPYFGAHMSISGGIEKSVERIMSVDGTALQIFSKNQRQWKSKPLEQKQIDAFKAACAEWGEYPIAVHDSYLINLGSPKEEGVEKSVVSFAHRRIWSGNRATDLIDHPVSRHVGSAKNKDPYLIDEIATEP